MSKHTPWTKEQAEQWADEWMAIPLKGADACIPADEMFRGAFLMGLAKAAEMIDACETIKYTRRNGKPHTGSYEVWEAKLVGVRTIDSDESGSGAPKCAK